MLQDSNKLNWCYIDNMFLKNKIITYFSDLKVYLQDLIKMSVAKAFTITKVSIKFRSIRTKQISVGF